jgi:hypothetical protein
MENVYFGVYSKRSGLIKIDITMKKEYDYTKICVVFDAMNLEDNLNLEDGIILKILIEKYPHLENYIYDAMMVYYLHTFEDDDYPKYLRDRERIKNDELPKF